MEAVLPPLAPGTPIEIWFADEARVGQQGTLTRVWAKRGTRPRALRDRRYAWAWLFGAVCPERGSAVALVLPEVSTAAMNLFLAELAGALPAGTHAVLVLDRAGWHVSRDLVVPRNLTLAHLPPYSPELNPVENVWAFLRSNKLSNRVFETYDAVVDACCEAWTWLIAQPDRITAIGTRSWAQVNQ